MGDTASLLLVDSSKPEFQITNNNLDTYYLFKDKGSEELASAKPHRVDPINWYLRDRLCPRIDFENKGNWEQVKEIIQADLAFLRKGELPADLKGGWVSMPNTQGIPEYLTWSELEKDYLLVKELEIVLGEFDAVDIPLANKTILAGWG